MGKSRSKRSHTISGSSEVVNRGDSVFIRSSDPSVPYVARIEDIKVNKAGEVNVKLLWYYRPEDTEGGRKPFHGSNELFLSDHVEIQPADTIEGHCSVHTLEKYTQLKSIDACDYFTRFQYRSATGRFLPRHVDRYCNCNMPYNPDLPMIECGSCKNWFHYSCLNIAVEGEETNFKCIKCTGKGKVHDDSCEKVPDDTSAKGSPAHTDSDPFGAKVPDDTSTKGCPVHTDSDPFGAKIEAKLKVNEKHSDAGITESVPVCLVKKEDAVKLKRNLRDRAETRHAPTDTVAADKRVALVYHDDMLAHTPPDKLANEKPERLVAIMTKLRIEGLTKRCHLFEAILATKESLIKVHSEDLVNKVQSLSEEDFGFESSDIYYSQGSSRAAFLAVGGSILASDLVGRGDFQSAFAIVRPPGHHVPKDGPSQGFCLMNNVAAATSNLKNNHGKKKILLLDWDIHHGDGTENIFYNENKVLFFSLHRFDKEFYPGTGSVDMIGGEDAPGYNVNVCWEHKHIRDVDYMAAWDYLLLPLIQEFVPEVIMISAGFDAASGDPLGKCKVTSAGFRWLLEKLTPYPIVMVLEGGYHLDSLSESVASCVRILLGERSGVGKSKSLPYASTWKMIKETREKLSPYWNAFREEIPDSITSRCRQNP